MALVSEAGICMRCRSTKYSFTDNYSLFAYDEKIRDLLARFKTRNALPLSALFAALIAPVIRSGYAGYALVPAPFRPRKKRERGWDQVEEICRRLRRGYGIPYHKLLRRTGSSPQKALGYEGRLSNLKGKITTVSKTVPGKILLLDDVFTTGATGDACAASLIRAGAFEVRMLTIAID
jgi:ComF family protein